MKTGKTGEDFNNLEMKCENHGHYGYHKIDNKTISTLIFKALGDSERNNWLGWYLLKSGGE